MDQQNSLLPPNGCQNREMMSAGTCRRVPVEPLCAVVQMPFDKPTKADLEKPDRMWLDQLAGRRNFDPSAFMGFINDLLLFEREDWRGLFADLPNGAGFVEKLSDFFARHRDGLRGHNCWHIYFHPLQRNALEQDRLIELAQRHVAELARIADLAGACELRERLSSLTAVWIDEHRERAPMPQDSSDLELEIYDTIGDFLIDNIAAQTPWFYCLKEACYAMAANYGLQRYFMSDYYRIRVDYGAYYELWIGGGNLFFDDDRCLVTPVERR
jgi:hypothetical protein